MLHHLPLALAGALLAASPNPGGMAAPPAEDDTGAPRERLTDAEAISVAAGTVLGAAAVCDEISKDRVKAATDSVADLVAAIATDDDELTSAKELFDDNAAVGREAVQSGDADCGSVEESLASLEKAAQPSGSSRPK